VTLVQSWHWTAHSLCARARAGVRRDAGALTGKEEEEDGEHGG
jgi:hypothetical protein